EEEIILKIYKRYHREFPQLRMVIAPRHVERASEVEGLIRSFGLNCCLFSKGTCRQETDSVLLIDTIGQLRQLYSVASFVFVGKSLTVPGGHNIIEPAFFAKPIVVGPKMQNFRDVMQAFVQAGAIVEVRDAQKLDAAVGRFLSEPAFAREIGHRAREVITQQKGATTKIVEEISRWME
ncbi:MAG: 3-deoxy-D-manno-octulosonic acid transferase, partial [Candidatus Omnitrophica bacterium]|nr:3-deoxy-D-manno-octulosonic acid transferase [Candidatus Omnitrophota bacterium]